MANMNAPQHTTLSQLQRSIQECVVGRFALPVWVSAEISDAKVNGSGHCYMELIEKGANDGIAKAQARAVIWRSGYSTIAQRFEAETGQRLERGITILAKVLVNYHELHGLSLQITDIDPTYTIGESERERQLAIAKLKANDSYDKNRELQLPKLVQRVAIISSSKAAGYQDFIREITSYEYHFELTLFEATMQGAGAEESIIEALIAIANRREEFDAVVIIRGGGSTSDLNCFNSYRLALHFARFPRPVISGIGHDKDSSVVDLVAHTALKTPTAVATWLVERMATLDGWLQSAAVELHRFAVEISRRNEILLEGYIKELTTRSEEMVNRNKKELIEMLQELPELAYNTILARQKELDYTSTIIEGYSPKRLLELGFVIARNQHNRATKSIDHIKTDDTLTIELIDGEVDTRVISCRKKV
ncbi:MAG: exodeoxyribonuclease VII large subunit [Rikenellaceae bacterium]